MPVDHKPVDNNAKDQEFIKIKKYQKEGCTEIAQLIAEIA